MERGHSCNWSKCLLKNNFWSRATMRALYLSLYPWWSVLRACAHIVFTKRASSDILCFEHSHFLWFRRQIELFPYWFQHFATTSRGVNSAWVNRSSAAIQKMGGCESDIHHIINHVDTSVAGVQGTHAWQSECSLNLPRVPHALDVLLPMEYQCDDCVFRSVLLEIVHPSDWVLHHSNCLS